MSAVQARTAVLRRAMLGAAALALVASALGVGVRSTFGGEAAVDEPQYLLTALSFWEDAGNDPLDISDELAAERWRAFHDAALPVQTEVQPDGRQVSPHDPLLPLLLAAPMGLGGYVAAKLTLAVLAAGVAALTVWIAVRRFRVRPAVAGVVVGVLAASPPLAVYGQQVYPELPAAGALLAVVAAATGPVCRRNLLIIGLALTALPWLSVKYAPVGVLAAVFVLVTLLRGGNRRAAAALAFTLTISGAVYLALHRLWWGGWTVYASGDHFVETGEFTVVGVSPDFAGRSLRLVGLLVDRGYGLAAWAPILLLTPLALAALLRRRPPGSALLLLAVAGGWAVATWVALTMHGFWWPGRQTVVVLPLIVIAIAWSLDTYAGRGVRLIAGGLAAAGLLSTSWLLADGWARELTWVSGFQEVGNPVYQVWRVVLPDYRELTAVGWLLHVGWVAALLALAGLGWRLAVAADPAPPEPVAVNSYDLSAPEPREPASTLTSS